MGGRGGRAGYLERSGRGIDTNPNPDSDQRETRRRNNPDRWDEQSLQEWEQNNPGWSRPDPSGLSQEEMQQFIDDHPGWGDQEPRENNTEGWGRQKLWQEISRAGSESEQNNIMDQWISDNGTMNQDGTVSFEMNGVEVTINPIDQRRHEILRNLIETGRIPKRLMEVIDSITISNTQIQGGIDYNNGDITVGAGTQPNSAEIAQAAAEGLAIRLYGSATPPSGTDYWRVMQTDEPPATDHGRAGPEADFAEAVRMYVANPRWLRDHRPLRWRVISRIFKSRRYKG